MGGRIVLFGATGYTGALVAAECAARRVPVVLAGRSRERLEQLAADLDGDFDVATADVDRPETVRRLVERGDVLISTVGPFAKFGAAAVAAALAAGADYLDSTGEPAFVRRVFEEWGPPAQRAGVTLLPAFGYDCVPGHVAGALALEAAGRDAVSVDIGYFSRGGRWSSGTLASLLGASRTAQFSWRDGKLVTERAGARTATFSVDGRAAEALSFGGSEHFALPRSYPALRTIGTYLGWFGPLTKPMQAVSAGQAMLERVPGAAAVVDAGAARFFPGSRGGPDEAARARTRSTFVAVARDRSGRELATVRLAGVDGYTLTARLLVWGATQLRDEAHPEPGARGPIEAFGVDSVRAALEDAGLRRQG